MRVKKSLFALLIFFECSAGFAQVQKRLLDADNNPTKNPIKAIAYMLYRKEGPDSLYSVVIMNMQNMPLVKGTFLDEDFKIPHGKFTYYKPYMVETKVGTNKTTLDSVAKVAQRGTFLNGSKEGVWVTYYPNGNKNYLQTFEADTLNGLYEQYDLSGKIVIRGNYIKNRKEGEWVFFRPDSSIAGISKYWHDNNYKTTEYSKIDTYVPPNTGFNFGYYIYQYLNRKKVHPFHGFVTVEYTIEVSGKLTNPIIKLGLDPVFDQEVINSIISCPSWASPARLNGKPTKEKQTFLFRYDAYLGS